MKVDQETEGKKSSVKKQIVNIGMSAIALGGMLGGAACETNQSSSPNSSSTGAYSSSSEIGNPTSFDNNENKGAARITNIVEIDNEALSKIPTIPSPPNPKHDIFLLYPFQNSSTIVALAYTKSFTMETPQTIARYNEEQINYAKASGIKDKIIFENVPANTPILAPFDGLLVYSRRPQVAPEGTIESIKILYKSPDGQTYQIIMSGRPGTIMKPAINTQPIIFDQKADANVVSVEVKRGQKVASTLQPLSEFDIVADSYSTENPLPNSIWPNNINLITVSSQGQNKMVMLKK